MALNNTYYLNVDVKDRYSGNKPKFRKGDSGVLIFTIFDKGKLVELPQNTTATLYQITSGGRRFSSPCTIETLDGRKVIKYEFKKSDTEDKGYNTVVLVISNGESVISIQPFEVIVYDDFDGGAGSFIDLIQDLMKLVNEMKFNADKTIRTFEKGVPNGVATLDSNGKVPYSQLQIDTDDSHLSETVFMNNVHGMRILDGYLQYLTPDGYVNTGTTPPTPSITASVQVSEGIATVTYQGNLTVSSQKWDEGSRSVSYFNNNGNSFTGNTFSIRGIGKYTLYYIDSVNMKHILEFTVTESMLPTTNVTVVVDRGEVDVTINRPTTIKKWSKGERDITYFANNGTVFTGNGFTVTEIGIYTIYYKIDSGAEYIYLFEVTDSMLAPTAPPPQISISTINGVSTVSINPYYTPSKYAFGDFTVEYFTSNGLLISGNTFVVTQAGLHTLYYTGSNGEKFVYRFIVDNSMLYQDVYAPIIRNITKVPNNWTNGNVVVKFEVTEYPGTSVVTKIASGERTASYFVNNGIILTPTQSVITPTLDLLETYEYTVVNINQKYTMYSIDTSGNYTLEVVEITNIDTTSPELELTQVNADFEQIIVINASDYESGVYSITLPNGDEFLESSLTYKVSRNGTYSFTAKDNAGNTITSSITVTALSR